MMMRITMEKKRRRPVERKQKAVWYVLRGVECV